MINSIYDFLDNTSTQQIHTNVGGIFRLFHVLDNLNFFPFCYIRHISVGGVGL